MGVVAVGRPCPYCFTLVTCTGADTDEFLHGTCPIDAVPMTIAHRHPAFGAVNYVAPDTAGHVPETGVASTSEADAKMPEMPPTIIDDSYVSRDTEQSRRVENP